MRRSSVLSSVSTVPVSRASAPQYLAACGLGLFTCLALFTGPVLAQDGAMKRTPAGKPDFSGVYDAGTVTPLERPPQYGDNLYMTPEEAKALQEQTAEFWKQAEAAKGGEADREAPKKGGDGDNRFGGGGVGGYNAFWIDPGTEATMVDGKFRTSLIYDPPNGRRPPYTPEGFKRLTTNFASFLYNNDGTASWLDKEGPGPFDGPETLALAERCLVGFSEGPPMIPSLYNNYLRIVQTEDHVMILSEMVHDVRIARFNSEHDPEDVKKWFGDPIAFWDGDTLVVESRNFRNETGLPGADVNLFVRERFTLTDEGLLYNFTVDDPTVWQAPWSAEYSWRASDSKVYEYACHEGNYAMINVLKGARLLESEYDEPPKRDSRD